MKTKLENINLSNLLLLAAFGMNIILFVCLYKLESRVSLLESAHDEPKKTKNMKHEH